MRIESIIDIDAPLSKVWDVTIDVEAYPKHIPPMTKVELLDGVPLTLGSRVRIKQRRQSAKVWTVTTFEPQHRFAWSNKAMGMTMTGWHTVEPIATGTRSTLAFELEGPLASLLGTLLKFPITKAITAENHGIKAASGLA